MLLSVMPYKAKLVATVLPTLRNLVHFSNSGIGSKYNFYSTPGSNIPSNLGAQSLQVQWSSAAKTVGEISCNAQGSFYFEATVSGDEIVSIFPSDAAIGGGGYYPENSVSWYRVNANSAHVVNYVGASETPRISCTLTGTSDQISKVWFFCTIKANKSLDVECVYYDGTLKKTAVKNVPNPGSKPFKISASSAYSASQTCVLSTGAAYWDTVRGSMNFSSYRTANYPAHSPLLDILSLVPRLTAYTGSGYTASASSEWANADYWRAYNPFSMDNEGNIAVGIDGGWVPASKPTLAAPAWLAMQFPSTLSVSRVFLNIWSSGHSTWTAIRSTYSIIKDFDIQTYNGTSWTTQLSVTNFDYTVYEYGRYTFIPFNLPAPTNCLGVRIRITALHNGSSGWDTGIIRCVYIE